MRQRDTARCPRAKTEQYIRYHYAAWGVPVHDDRRRGFTFVGSTICYAFMQAVGMVNDHLVDCFRHCELRKAGSARR
jgi:3-methyladenine DNA glycosylase Tag